MGQNICGAMNAQNNQPISNMQDISELDFNRNSTYKKLEQYSVNVCKEKEIPHTYIMLIQRLLSMGQHPLFEHISQLQTQEKKNDYLRYLDSISHEMEVIDSLFHHFIQQSSESQDDQDEIVDIIKHISNVQNIEDMSYEDYERSYSTGLKLIRQKQGKTSQDLKDFRRKGNSFIKFQTFAIFIKFQLHLLYQQEEEIQDMIKIVQSIQVNQGFLLLNL